MGPRRRSGRSTRPRRPSLALNPRRQRGDVRRAARRRQTSSTSSTATDVIVDGTDNFPDALPRQRRLAAQADSRRARLDLPVRGPGLGVQALRGPVLPLLPAPSRRRPRLAPSCAEAGVLGRAARHHRARSRPWRPSSCCSTWATRSSAGSWAYDALSKSRSGSSRSTAIPTARPAARTAGRDRHRPKYDELCMAAPQKRAPSS